MIRHVGPVMFYGYEMTIANEKMWAYIQNNATWAN